MKVDHQHEHHLWPSWWINCSYFKNKMKGLSQRGQMKSGTNREVPGETAYKRKDKVLTRLGLEFTTLGHVSRAPPKEVHHVRRGGCGHWC